MPDWFVSPCPIGGAGGAYWVKAPLQPGLEELEALMESRPRFSPVWRAGGAYGVINDHLSPGIYIRQAVGA